MNFIRTFIFFSFVVPATTTKKIVKIIICGQNSFLFLFAFEKRKLVIKLEIQLKMEICKKWNGDLQKKIGQTGFFWQVPF